MKRYLPLCLTLLLAGCTTDPGGSEAVREVVLKYVDADVGTAGPFGKQGKKELDILSDKDRAAALALLDRGAVGFVVFARDYGAAARPGSNDTATTSRIILVLKGKVVGDFRAAK